MRSSLLSHMWALLVQCKSKEAGVQRSHLPGWHWMYILASQCTFWPVYTFINHTIKHTFKLRRNMYERKAYFSGLHESKITSYFIMFTSSATPWERKVPYECVIWDILLENLNRELCKLQCVLPWVNQLISTPSKY